MKPGFIVRYGKHIAEKVSRAFAGRKNRPDIFISATSADLGTVRKIARDALLDSDCFPVEQSHFSPDYRKVEDMLRAKISNCQAMIHIVGMRYGFEPNSDNRPPNVPRRSYTQMEYHIAKELGIRCYVFICPEDFPYDEARDPESQDLQNLQQAHRQQFLGSDTVFTEFTDRDQLKEGVLKLQNQLSELRDRVDKNSLRMWFAVLMNWLVLSMIVGGLWWGVDKIGTSADSIVTELRKDNTADRLHAQAAADSIIQELKKDNSPDRLHVQAAAHFDGKNYAGAFHVYAQLSDADPGNLELHRRMEQCARMGHLEKPFLDRYLTLVQRQPDNAIFHNYLGNAYLMLDPKDLDGKGRECYESAIRLDPQLSPPMANLGILCFRAGKSDEAEKHFKNYLSAQPKDAQAWVNLGLLYLAKVQANTNDTEAIVASEKTLNKAIQIAPGSFSAFKAFGRLYMTTGRMKDAGDAYRRSLALNGDQPDVRKLIAGEFGDARTFGTQTDDFTTRSPQSSNTNLMSQPSKDKEPIK